MPLPSRSPDARLDALGTAAGLLVVSFRLWALPYARPERPHPDWRAGLRAAGLGEIAQTLFDPLLATIFTAARRPIEVHQLGCRGVSGDERRFLDCVTCYQHDRLDDAMALLASWLHPSGARIAGALALRLAAALGGGGLLLPRHTADGAALRQIPAGAGPGLALVH